MSILLKMLNWKLFGGLFLGWGVGANDSANIFGTAVATNSVRFRTAVTLIAIFAILGSCIHGRALFHEMNFSSGSQPANQAATAAADDPLAANAAAGSQQTRENTIAFFTTLAAAITILIMTYAAIPASCSQAAVGAIIGITICTSGFAQVDWSKLGKMFICWVGNPIGAAICTVMLYKVVAVIIRLFVGTNLTKLNTVYRWLLLIAGSYGAYELGANNVVVTTAPYFNAGMFGDPKGTYDLFYQDPAFIAALIGGLSIAFGAITYSKKVMATVGNSITALDPYSAMITVFAHSLSLMVFTWLKVPVSSSQAIVGSVLGIGLLKGGRAISYKTLGWIFVGWLLTPIIGAGLAVGFYKLFL